MGEAICGIYVLHGVGGVFFGVVTSYVCERVVHLVYYVMESVVDVFGNVLAVFDEVCECKFARSAYDQKHVIVTV